MRRRSGPGRRRSPGARPRPARPRGCPASAPARGSQRLAATGMNATTSPTLELEELGRVQRGPGPGRRHGRSASAASSSRNATCHHVSSSAIVTCARDGVGPHAGPTDRCSTAIGAGGRSSSDRSEATTDWVASAADSIRWRCATMTRLRASTSGACSTSLISSERHAEVPEPADHLSDRHLARSIEAGSRTPGRSRPARAAPRRGSAGAPSRSGGSSGRSPRWAVALAWQRFSTPAAAASTAGVRPWRVDITAPLARPAAVRYARRGVFPRPASSRRARATWPR